MKIWIILIGVGLVCAGLWHYRALMIENAELKSQIETANTVIDSVDFIVKGMNEIHDNERQAIDAIEQAPDTDDGPLAPVLRDTLGRL